MIKVPFSENIFEFVIAFARISSRRLFRFPHRLGSVLKPEIISQDLEFIITQALEQNTMKHKKQTKTANSYVVINIY